MRLFYVNVLTKRGKGCCIKETVLKLSTLIFIKI